MWWLFTTLAAAAYTGSANVQFASPITAVTLDQLTDILGYAPTDFVARRCFLLYLTPALATGLAAAFPDVTVTPFDGEKRCAPNLALDVVTGDGQPIGYLSDRTHPGRVSMPARAALTSELRVLLHPGSLVEYTSEEREQVLASFANWTRKSAHQYTTVVSSDAAAMDLASLLVAVPFVQFVDVLRAPLLQNLWSSATSQDLAISDASASAADACGDDECRPLWAAGLTGRGQIVGISDTGVATNVCHFRDDSGAPVPYTSTKAVPADTGHRSIVAYRTYGDGSDGDGHGTHVAGTIAGNALTNGTTTGLSAADFNGVAPNAKLVVVDLQAGTGGLSVPSPYDTELYPFMVNAGASILSGSWGIADFSYSSEDYVTDRYAYEHPFILIIFAAGNSGKSKGAASILSPGLAKNVLTVGETRNTQRGCMGTHKLRTIRRVEARR